VAAAPPLRFCAVAALRDGGLAVNDLDIDHPIL
jgi:hypothetical protein